MTYMALSHFDKDGQRREYENTETLFGRLGQDGFIWVDIDDPEPEKLKAIATRLGIHPLAVEDCLDENQVPKFEEYPDHAFALLNYYSYDGSELTIGEADFIFNDKFLVSVHGHGSGNPCFFRALAERIRLPANSQAVRPDALVHILMDDITDAKFAVLKAIEDETDSYEDTVLENPEAFDLKGIAFLRKRILALSRSLSSEREVLVRICYKDSAYVSEAAGLYYRDIYDHLSKFLGIAEACRDAITSTMELYFSAMDNRVNKISVQTNMTMRRLTLITTIFMPLSLLAGIGGMSEYSMMTGPSNWRISYPLFLGGMAIIGVITYLALKHLGKIRDGRRLKRLSKGN